MKKLLLLVFGLTLTVFFAEPLHAADKVYHLSIKDAMETKDAKEKLSGEVKFYFGKQSHPAIRSNLGEYVSNKKANSFGKNNETACQRSFLSAMISLEDRAKKLGADAVVGIESYYKKVPFSSTTQFECHAGTLMAGVALRGKFVKTGRK